MRLSFVQRMELQETGTTWIWVRPCVIPETDEITFGYWQEVVRRGRTYELTDNVKEN